MSMIFEQLNPHSCRTYMVGYTYSNEIVLIDPVLDHLNDYTDLIEKKNLKLTHVVDTHTHADHISGCAALKDLTDCEYAMHINAPSHCVTLRVNDGYKCNLCGLDAEIIETPGHTQDAISIVFPDRIFTGDALFLDDGGAGRDDLPGGDPAAHWESLQRIMSLPEHLVVYPAHEYRDRESSSLARQKITNPHLKHRSKEEFIQYIEDLKLGPADWMKDVLKANYACARDPKAAWIPVDVPACEVKGTLAKGVNDQQVASVTPRELKHRLDNGQKMLLLDVREEKELTGRTGHLPGIMHIPITSLPSRLVELEQWKDDEIITLCRTGSRAHTAAQILAQAGFKRAYVLNGGMLKWNEEGLPTVREWPEA